MNYPSYDWVVVAQDFSRWDFTSIGKKGPVRKGVSFSKIEEEEIYNLAFGDLDENGEINDLSVSDNGDRDVVLATVAKIVTEYTTLFPDRWVVFKGSTEARTRLYRMVIGSHLSELSLTFEIYVFSESQWVRFVRNMKVDVFLIKKKNM